MTPIANKREIATFNNQTLSTTINIPNVSLLLMYMKGKVRYEPTIIHVVGNPTYGVITTATEW